MSTNCFIFYNLTDQNIYLHCI